ncbi:ornithine cyclodeaminase family protein [Oryzibacter oryziterrae]|uniref:ornithine cyclodeaminase family protein n=1 Tax=Oryzibacter oryziterrae TaxID=2766474 RepID=UPI001F3A4F64|nr:ornithine cyclodeaminase family protein [Oryzibacter oryziterrae]
MKIFSAEDTAAALPYDRLIEGIRVAFAEGFQAPLRHHHTMPRTEEADAVLLLMPSWAGNGTYGGVKIVNVTPGNAARGLDAVTSSYILFDEVTGRHLALLDGGTLTSRRTAAASALAASYLAREDARSLLVVGAGRVGAEIPAAYKAIRPIERVTVWNPTERRGAALVASLQAEGWDARFEPDLPKAIAQADIISCATLSKAPLVTGDLLRPGQHLDLIGSFTPEMREADDAAMQKGRVFIDTEAAAVESGDIRLPLASGALDRASLATLYDLCGNKTQGRRSAEEITIFKGVGVAIEDLAAAIVAVRSAG